MLPPRASVVPQWAFDSANFRVRADERRYAPGKRPPPHLSPFADAADDGGYVPAYAEELRALREASARRAAKGAGGTAAADALAEFEAAAAAVAERGGGGGAGGGAGAAGGDGEKEEAPDAIDADEAAAAAAHAEGLARELGLSVPKKSKASAAASTDDAVKPSAEVAKAADADRMRAAMLPRKKRHLYESVRKAQDAKKARGEKLAEKAAAANAAAGAGK